MLKFLTYTHILAGIVSLVAAPVAMAVWKGGTVHRVSGKAFFWSMTWIFITAVILSVYNWIPFLLMISVFSYYSAFIGYRSLYQKRLHSGLKPRWYDWTGLVIALLAMSSFIGWGVYLVIKGVGAISWLAIGFGTGGMLLVVGRLRVFLKPPTVKHEWLFNHIGSMTGAYIASVTAFSTNVLLSIPGIWQWLWPTLLGTPFIIYSIRSYRRKLEAGEKITDLVKIR